MDDPDILKNIEILYVEDDELAREAVAKFLRRRCKEVYEADNGKTGLELYEKHRPDVVVTDVAMPIMNGLDMLNKILKIKESQPIIIVTAYNDDDHRSDRARLNMIKPIVKEDLLDAIIGCLKKTYHDQ